MSCSVFFLWLVIDYRVQAMVKSLLIGLVKGYRFFLSPWLGSACRFEPSCSRYALDTLQLHGAATGSYLVTRRLLRCHPWCDGGLDPVPRAALFSRLVTPSSEKIHP